MCLKDNITASVSYCTNNLFQLKIFLLELFLAPPNFFMALMIKKASTIYEKILVMRHGDLLTRPMTVKLKMFAHKETRVTGAS